MKRRNILSIEILEDRDAMSSFTVAQDAALLPAVHTDTNALIGLLHSETNALIGLLHTDSHALIGLLPAV